jgi:hypothetical protein
MAYQGIWQHSQCPGLQLETALCLPVIMPQMTIFECQKDKNMTRVKNKVINVKVVLEFIS